MFQKIYLFSLVSLSFVFVLPEANAKIQEFKYKEGSVNAELPSNWDHMEDFLGTPVTLYSPLSTSGKRAVIQITPYGVKDKDDVLRKAPKDIEEYVKQKEDWLENVDGEAISYDSFHEENVNGSRLYSIGLSYSVTQGKFHQQTFYITDKNKNIFFVSALVPLDLDDQNRSIIKEVARSIASVK